MFEVRKMFIPEWSIKERKQNVKRRKTPGFINFRGNNGF